MIKCYLQTYEFISFITRRIKLKIIHKITKTQSHQISVSLRLHVSKPTNQLLTINYTLFIVHCKSLPQRCNLLFKDFDLRFSVRLFLSFLIDDCCRRAIDEFLVRQFCLD